MNYLYCIKDGTETYIEVTDAQEEKITTLTREHKLPKSIIIGDSEVDTSTIIGFTAKAPKPMPKISSFDELRAWVHDQPWYRRSNLKDQAQSS